jgi:hypothetical protein
MKKILSISTVFYYIILSNIAIGQTFAGGNYYIGGTGTTPASGCTYVNLNQAFNDINSSTITGAVNLILTVDYASSQEIYPLTLNSNSGSSPTNTITVKPDTGVNVVILGATTSSILHLNGVDYFILDGSNNGTSSINLIIKNLTSTGNVAAIWLSSISSTDGATHNIIKNCNISTGSALNTNAYIISISGSAINTSGNNNDNNIIVNNVISKGGIGVLIFGTTANSSDSNMVAANIIDSLCSVGISSTYSNSTILSNNIIQNISSATFSPIGIQLQYTNTNSIISGNRIYNIQGKITSSVGGKGIWLFYTGSNANIKIYNNVINNIYGAAFNTAGPSMIAGIGVYGSGSHIYIYYNSINLYGGMSCNCSSGNQPYISAALFLDATTSVYLYVKNNALVNGINNFHTGNNLPITAYSIYDARTVQLASTLNNNDYYAYGPYAVLGYFKANRITLSDWKTATAQDANSIAADPLFNSNTQLEPLFNSPLLAAGSPLTGYTTDILNATRNGTSPTIGAFENMIDVTGPTISYTKIPRSPSTSSRTLIAKITDISDVPTSGMGLPRLYWKINRTGSYSAITGTSVGNSNYSFNFGLGAGPGDSVFFFIVAQDSNIIPRTSCYPLLGAAGFSANPPQVSKPPTNPDYYQILPELPGGNYYIGGSGSSPAIGCNFVDITQAFYVLNNISLTGPVNFIITSHYNSMEDTFPAILNDVYNSSSTNTITLKPDISVKVDLKGFAAPALIKLNGTDYFMIDGSNNGSNSIDMTIRNSFINGDYAAIFISSPDSNNGAHHNTIKNCNIYLDSVTYNNNYVIAIGGANLREIGFTNNNITIRNNKISNSQFGIYEWGTDKNITDSLVIEENSFDSLYIGMILTYTKSARIAYNIIRNIVSPMMAPMGIALNYTSTNAQIIGNTIFNVRYTSDQNNGAKGISIFSTGANANISICNNSISNLSGNGTGNGTFKTAGIYLYGKNENINIFFNSVNLYGNLTCKGGVFPHDCSALTISYESKYLNIQNNIFVNGQYITNYPSSSYAIYNEAPLSAFNVINNNNYFAYGAQGILGRNSITDYYKISDWIGAIKQDSASVSVNPLFHSISDLRPTSRFVNNIGKLIAGILNDLEKTPRRLLIPDIGAFEFTLPPIVITQSDSNLTSKSVRLFGFACAQNEPDTKIKFEVGTTLSYGTSINAIPFKISTNDTLTVFADVTGLIPKTLYHYRIIGENDSFIAHGFDSVFTTPGPEPSIQTGTATSISAKTAILNAIVNPHNELTDVSFEWGATNAYGNTVIPVISPLSGDSNINISYQLINLIPFATYHYRVKAMNITGTQFGFDMAFNTNDTAPKVTSAAVSNLTYNGASAGGNIIDNGGSPISGRGVCWNTTGNPTADLSSKTLDGAGSGNFNSSVTNLNSQTLYYLRAYAINGLGTFYGNQISFTTLPNALPMYLNEKDITIYSLQKNIFIEVHSIKTLLNCQVLIFDLNGKIIKTSIIKKGLNNINLSEFASGIYQVLVVANNGIIRKKIIIE